MKKAFTLIELLVVIAIIAILAAILFPVFAQAKTAAKKTQDLSNQKNLGMAVNMYMSDSDDVYPLGKYPFGTNGEENSWAEQIFPYVKNGEKQGTSLGGQRATGTGGIFLGPGYPKATQQGGSYVVHRGLFPEYDSSKANLLTGPTVSQTSITMPAEKILMFHRGAGRTNSVQWNWVTFLHDEWNWVDWMGMNDENGTPTNGAIKHFSVEKDANGQPVRGDCDDMRSGGDPVWEYCSHYPRYRYNGTVNVAFTDGHAKAFRRSENSTQINYARNIFLQGISNNGENLW